MTREECELLPLISPNCFQFCPAMTCCTVVTKTLLFSPQCILRVLVSYSSAIGYRSGQLLMRGLLRCGVKYALKQAENFKQVYTPGPVLCSWLRWS